MKCIDCQIDMMTYTVAGVALDLCPRCKGVWFDKGELEKCLSMSPKNISECFGDAVIIPKCEGFKGAPRVCPRCGKSLKKERFNGGVWTDKCIEGCGIWLDESEMTLAKANTGPTASKGIDSSDGAISSIKRLIATVFGRR